MKKIFLIIITLLLCGCSNKLIIFTELEDYKYIIENKENIENTILKKEDKCYLLDKEKTLEIFNNIIIKDNAINNEYKDNYYIIFEFNENIDNKYYFEGNALYEEKLTKTFQFNDNSFIYSGNKYALEKEINFTTQEIDNNKLNITYSNEIDCNTYRKIVKTY